MCDKKALRARFAKTRAEVRSEDADRRMFAQLRRSSYWAAERFFVYCAVGTEADTRLIIEALLAEGKRVCVPRIENGRMLAAPYGKLAKGAYGIPAPETGEDTPCEVALTPLLAVDAEGYRLGYGGGYYDAYFARHPEILRVGLCYAAQLTDRLPREEQDVPLQAVVTENGVIRFDA